MNDCNMISTHRNRHVNQHGIYEERVFPARHAKLFTSKKLLRGEIFYWRHALGIRLHLTMASNGSPRTTNRIPTLLETIRWYRQTSYTLYMKQGSQRMSPSWSSLLACFPKTYSLSTHDTLALRHHVCEQDVGSFQSVNNLRRNNSQPDSPGT